MTDRLFVVLQHLLPRYALTALVYRLARLRTPRLKNAMIRQFVRLYDVDLAGVQQPVPEGFATFNDFFTRALEPGARPVCREAAALVSPVDGTVSAAGHIEGDAVFQAKGRHYSLADLLLLDTARARGFHGGNFATIYLAPYNYHRVHAFMAGELDVLHYVPGDLFSVNSATAAHVPRLFARNERLVMHFATERGPAALVFVGALNVGSISTPWTGEIRPRRRGSAEQLDAGDRPRQVAAGDLLGWFNMGSTVILLLPAGTVEWQDDLAPGTVLRMGEQIGSVKG
ncbi:MAG: archaetidylserine decarboxylase [Pseudomonadota bacterium]